LNNLLIEKALSIAKENLADIEERFEIDLKDKAKFIVSGVDFFDEKVDLVVQNPPFGIKGDKHADKVFLEKAFRVSDVIYSFHKAESKGFLNAVTKDNDFKVEEYWEFDWPLKQTMKYHTKKIQYIKVGCWKLVKK